MTSLAPTNGRDYAPAQNDQPLLRFEHVTKQFGGTLAVNDVTFDLFSHEVLALLGGNGAGKSTLIKILAGVHAPSRGEIFFQGRPVSHFGGKPPIDVGSKAEIYAFLVEVLKRGISVLMISTDFEEIANICPRALVFFVTYGRSH